MSIIRQRRFQIEEPNKPTFLNSEEKAKGTTSLNNSYLTKTLMRGRKQEFNQINQVQQRAKQFINDYKTQYTSQQLPDILKQGLMHKLLNYEPTFNLKNRSQSKDPKRPYSVEKQQFNLNSYRTYLAPLNLKDRSASKSEEPHQSMKVTFQQIILSNQGSAFHQFKFCFQAYRQCQPQIGIAKIVIFHPTTFLSDIRSPNNMRKNEGRNKSPYLNQEQLDADKLRAENVYLKNKLDSLQKEQEESRNQNEKARQYYQQCLIQKQSEIDSLKIENISFQSTVQELDSQLQEAHFVIEQLYGDISQINNKDDNSKLTFIKGLNLIKDKNFKELQKLKRLNIDNLERKDKQLGFIQEQIALIQRHLKQQNDVQPDSIRQVNHQQIIEDMTAQRNNLNQKLREYEQKNQQQTKELLKQQNLNSELTNRIHQIQQQIEGERHQQNANEKKLRNQFDQEKEQLVNMEAKLRKQLEKEQKKNVDNIEQLKKSHQNEQVQQIQKFQESTVQQSNPNESDQEKKIKDQLMKIQELTQQKQQLMQNLQSNFQKFQEYDNQILENENQKQSLLNQLQQQKQENEELQNQLGEILKDYQDIHQTTNTQVDHLESNLIEYKQQLYQLKSETDRKDLIITQLEAEIQSNNQLNKTLNQEYEQAQQLILMQQGEKDKKGEYQATILHMEQQYQNLNSQYNDLLMQKDQDARQLLEAEQNQQEKDELNGQLENQISELQLLNMSMKIQNDENLTSIQVLQRQIQQKEDNIQIQLAALSQDHIRQNEEKGKIITQLQQQMHEKTAEIQEQGKLLEDLNQQIKLLQDQLLHEQIINEELSSNLQQLESQNKVYSGNLYELKEQNLYLQKENENLKHQQEQFLKDQNNAIQKVYEENTKLVHENQNYEQSINQLKNELLQIAVQNDEALLIQQNLQSQLNNQMSKLEEYKYACEEYIIQIQKQNEQQIMANDAQIQLNQTIEQLQEQIQQQNQEILGNKFETDVLIEKLQQQLEQLEQQAQNKDSMLSKQAQEKEQQTQEYQITLKSMEEQLKLYIEKNNQYEEQLKCSEQLISNKEETILQQNNQLEEQKNILEQLSHDYQGFEKKKEELLNQNKEKQTIIDNLQLSWTILTDEKEKLNLLAENLKNQVQQLKEEKGQLQQQIENNNLDQLFQDVQKQCHEQGEQIQILLKERGKLEGDTNNLNSQLNELTNQFEKNKQVNTDHISELMQEIEKKDSLINNLNLEKETVQQLMSQLKSQQQEQLKSNEEQINIINDLRKNNDELQIREVHLTTNNHDKQNIIEDLQDQQLIFKDQIKKFTSQIETLTNESQQVNAQNEMLQLLPSQIETLNNENQQVKAKYEMLLLQIQDFSKQMEKLNHIEQNYLEAQKTCRVQEQEIKILEQKNDQLTQGTNGVEGQLSELKNQIESQKTYINDLKVGLQQENDKNLNLTNELNELKVLLEKLEQQSQNYEQEQIKLHDEQNSTIIALKQNNDDLQRNQDTLVSQNQQNLQIIDAQQNQQTSLKDELEKLALLNENLKNEIQQLNAQKEQLQKQISGLTIQMENNNIDQLYLDIQKQCNDQGKQIVNLLEETGKLEQNINNLNHQLKELTNELENEKKKTHNQNLELQNERAEYQNSIKELNQDKNKLEKLVSQLKNQEIDQMNHLNQQNNIINGLRKDNQEFQQEVQVILLQNQELQKTIDDFQYQQQTHNDEYKKMINANDVLKSQITNLEAEKQQFFDQIQDLTIKIQNNKFDQLYFELQQQCNEQVVEIQKLVEEKRRLEDFNDQLKVTKNELDQQQIINSKLKDSLETQNQEINNLTNALNYSKIKVEEIEKINDQLNQDNTEFRECIEQLKNLINNFNLEQTDRNNQIAVLNERIELANQEIQKQQQIIEQSNIKLESLNQKKIEQEKSIEELNQENQSLRIAMKEESDKQKMMYSAQQDKESIIQKQENQIQELKNNFTDIQAQYTTKSQEINQLSQLLQKAKEDIIQLEDKADRQSVAKSSRSLNLSQQLARFEDFNEENEQQEHDDDDILQLHSLMQTQNKNQDDKDPNKEINIILQSKLNEMEQELNSLKQLVTQLTKDLTTYKEDNKDFQEQLQELRDQNETMNLDNEYLKASNERYMQELEKQMAELLEKAQEIQDLEEYLQIMELQLAYKNKQIYESTINKLQKAQIVVIKINKYICQQSSPNLDQKTLEQFKTDRSSIEPPTSQSEIAEYSFEQLKGLIQQFLLCIQQKQKLIYLFVSNHDQGEIILSIMMKTIQTAELQIEKIMGNAFQIDDKQKSKQKKDKSKVMRWLKNL